MSNSVDKKIEEIEKKIEMLADEINEITGVLVDMTIALSPIVDEWIRTRKKTNTDDNKNMYV